MKRRRAQTASARVDPGFLMQDQRAERGGRKRGEGKKRKHGQKHIVRDPPERSVALPQGSLEMRAPGASAPVAIRNPRQERFQMVSGLSPPRLEVEARAAFSSVHASNAGVAPQICPISGPPPLDRTTRRLRCRAALQRRPQSRETGVCLTRQSAADSLYSLRRSRRSSRGMAGVPDDDLGSLRRRTEARFGSRLVVGGNHEGAQGGRQK